MKWFNKFAGLFHYKSKCSVSNYINSTRKPKKVNFAKTRTGVLIFNPLNMRKKKKASPSMLNWGHKFKMFGLLMFLQLSKQYLKQ